MTDPFNNEPMLLQQKAADFNFRKESFQILYHYFECQEVFTGSELDEINANQLYKQYREKYGIPSPKEIAAIR